MGGTICIHIYIYIHVYVYTHIPGLEVQVCPPSAPASPVESPSTLAVPYETNFRDQPHSVFSVVPGLQVEHTTPQKDVRRKP